MMTSGAFAVVAAAAAMAAALGASPASATIYGQQYRGTVSGTGTYGLFGAAGATLTNAPYLATFSINTSTGSVLKYSDSETENNGGSASITAVIAV
jgi:hypothetical protein